MGHFLRGMGLLVFAMVFGCVNLDGTAVTGGPGVEVDKTGDNSYRVELAGDAGTTPQAMGTANRIAKFTTPTRLGDSALVESGRNIGWGTDAPTAALHIYESGTSDVGIKIEQTTSTRWSYLGLTNGPENWYLVAGGSGNLGIHYGALGADQKVVISPNGNVGIGAAKPEARLHLQSAGKAQLRIDDITAQRTGVGGALLFGGNYRALGDISAFAKIAAEKTNNVDGDYSYNLAFYTVNNGGINPPAGTPQMVIDNEGKVGVGTSAPKATLHIKQRSNDINGGIVLEGQVLNAGACYFFATGSPCPQGAATITQGAQKRLCAQCD